VAGTREALGAPDRGAPWARAGERAKATIGSLKLGCADGIKTRICEDVATRHIVSFIQWIWSDA
jgi:hypothetical protein